MHGQRYGLKTQILGLRDSPLELLPEVNVLMESYKRLPRLNVIETRREQKRLSNEQQVLCDVQRLYFLEADAQRGGGNMLNLPSAQSPAGYAPSP